MCSRKRHDYAVVASAKEMGVATFVIAQRVSAAEESEMAAFVIAQCVSAAKEAGVALSRTAAIAQTFRRVGASPRLWMSRLFVPALSVARKLSRMRAIIQRVARHQATAPYNKRLQATRSKQRAPETRR